jgi:predicted porin
VLTVWLTIAAAVAGAQTVVVDSQTLKQLQETIQQQQELLQRQSRELKSQAEMLNALQQQVDALSRQTTEATTQAAQAQTTAQEAVATAQQAAPAAPVTSGQERVKLAISGQVNRAVNMVDDGDNLKAYYVDNDVSNSRARLVGTAKLNDDLTLGSRLEFAFAPNESSTVTQGNEGGDENYVQGRWAEVSLASKNYGKLSLGKGDTASNNTSQVDLSRTDVIMYSSVSDIVAGLQFRTRGGKNLTGIEVSDAFNDQDGLSRQSRLRYDTPSFHGFSLAGSVVSNQRADAALFWGGQGYGFKAAAAAAVSDPNQDNTDLRYNGSFSMLHEVTGLNLTLSSGLLDRDDRDDPLNLYAKLGWIAEFWDLGTTAFGVDYTRSFNTTAEDDEGYSIGAAVVQLIEPFGTELYLQYRLFSLDRDAGPGVEDIHAGTLGARVKF